MEDRTIHIKSKREIQLMRETCLLAAQTLTYIKPFVKPGATTEELNQLCHEFILKHDAIPAPLNYHGFPKSICTSPNDVICHGIPDESVVVKDGDILNIDVTTILNQFHGDTNRTFYVGEVSEENKKLVKVTYECMMAGIAQVRPGGRIGDIGAVIEEMANDHGYGVVHEYCGHGIGRGFHEEPQVVHYGVRGTGAEIVPGMTFTVEPMINLGKRYCRVLKDEWTVITKDGKNSAQFEHTVLVTEDGYEILTIDPESPTPEL